MRTEFPLTDCDGVYVSHDRRDGDERRKSSAALEDILILFSQLPSEDPGRAQTFDQWIMRRYKLLISNTVGICPLPVSAT